MSVLVAGIGNVFLGDDAFGVEVVRRLAARALPDWLHVVDFGIRGFDLAYALVDGPEAAILVDAAPSGQPPGTVVVFEPEVETEEEPSEPGLVLDTHAMDPVKVLRLVHALGGKPVPLRVVACEPLAFGSDDDDMAVGLSAPVEAAVEPAVELVLAVARELRAGAARHA